MEEDLLELYTGIKVWIRRPTRADEVPKKVKEVKKERVPHRQEGGERPVVVAIEELVDAGSAIGANVEERKEGVEEGKES